MVVSMWSYRSQIYGAGGSKQLRLVFTVSTFLNDIFHTEHQQCIHTCYVRRYRKKEKGRAYLKKVNLTQKTGRQALRWAPFAHGRLFGVHGNREVKVRKIL